MKITDGLCDDISSHYFCIQREAPDPSETLIYDEETLYLCYLI